jgi:hypothetical protein
MNKNEPLNETLPPTTHEEPLANSDAAPTSMRVAAQQVVGMDATFSKVNKVRHNWPCPAAAPSGVHLIYILSDTCVPAITPAMWPQDLLFRFLARAKRFLLANSLVVGFVIGTIWALSSPQQGQALSSLKMGDFRAIEFFNNCMVGGHALRPCNRVTSDSEYKLAYATLCILLV